ncbi:MAG: type II secretion system F family protein [Candidatus Hydrogenedentes bacterium]|nr:type II secretion system F family protein [Candidatus Hydrogenedentota bacterium]
MNPGVYWQNHWDNLILVVEELGGLITSNVPLAEGLLALAEDAPNRRVRGVFEDLHYCVVHGNPLSEAMERYPEFFPSFCAGAVRAGEESGHLAEVLYDLQREMMEMLAFRRRTQDVGYYLFGVMLVEALLILGLLQFVMPQFVEIFASFGGGPTFAIRLLITAQAWYLPQFLVLFAAGIPVLWLWAQWSALRGGALARELGELGMRLPVARGILLKRHLAHASAVAGLLVEAGVPLHTAFRAAADAVRNVVCRDALFHVGDALEQGASLRDAVQAESSALPQSFRVLLVLGEAAGQVPEALRQVTETYRRAALRTARLALEIGGPLLLCLTGGIVFVVDYAFFQWISHLSSLIDTTP